MWDKHRSDQCRQLLGVRVTVGAGNQLDDATPAAGVFDVLGGKLGDALTVYQLRVQLAAKGKGCQNADFAAGIQALHIGSRVCFSVAQLLCHLQRLGKAHPFAAHLS